MLESEGLRGERRESEGQWSDGKRQSGSYMELTVCLLSCYEQSPVLSQSVETTRRLNLMRLFIEVERSEADDADSLVAVVDTDAVLVSLRGEAGVV